MALPNFIVTGANAATGSQLQAWFRPIVQFSHLTARADPAFWAIVGLSLGIRLVFIAATSDYQALSDAADYYRHAESIAAGAGYPESEIAGGGGPSAFRPPGYPYFLGGVFAAFGDSVAVARVAAAVLGALATAFVYMMARRLWNRDVAVVAGLLAAIYPPLVLWQTTLLSEPLFLALELAVIVCVLALRESRQPIRWAVLAGALCGAAALTRGNGAVLVIPAALGAWTLFPRISRRGLAPPLTVIAVAAVVVASWTIRNAIELDRFVPVTTEGGMALSGTYNQLTQNASERPASFSGRLMLEAHGTLFERRDLQEPELEDELRSRAVDFAVSNPDYVVKVCALNLMRSLGFAEIWPPNLVPVHGATVGADGVSVLRWVAVALTLLALLAAVILTRRGSPSWGPLFVWLTPLLMIASAIPISGDTRYRAPVDPFLVLLGAFAVVWLWHHRPTRLRGTR